MNRDLLRYWPLDPDVAYLNHGAYGACPWPVLHAQSEWRARLERQPTLFMASALEGHLDRARSRLAEFLGADPADVAFVPNATTGVNTVLKSIELAPGNEVLTTDHEYNACRNAIDHVAGRSGARVVVARVPLPVPSAQAVVDAIVARATQRTRVAVISHVTSATALVFPIAQIVAALAERGIDTLVDGAHAPGMVPVDLDALGAAYYAGNCHKWVCAPKGSGFLHVRRDLQPSIHPLVTSHGRNSPRRDRSAFRLEFDWTGTGDPSAYLAVPDALDFTASLMPAGWSDVMEQNRRLVLAGRERLIAALGSPTGLAPEDMIGSMASVELPVDLGPAPPEPAADASAEDTYPLDPLHGALLDEYHIEVPIVPWPQTAADGLPRRRLLRVSAQLYNAIDDYARLADALSSRLA